MINERRCCKACISPLIIELLTFILMHEYVVDDGIKRCTCRYWVFIFLAFSAFSNSHMILVLFSPSLPASQYVFISPLPCKNPIHACCDGSSLSHHFSTKSSISWYREKLCFIILRKALVYHIKKSFGLLKREKLSFMI